MTSDKSKMTGVTGSKIAGTYYCDKCGGPVRLGANYCARCGGEIVRVALIDVPRDSKCRRLGVWVVALEKRAS